MKKEKASKKESKLKFKNVMKASKVEIKLKPYKAESSWDDPQRFFKNEMEETKRSMFL